MQRVDPDPVGRNLFGDRLGQAGQAVLGCAVGGLHRHRLEPGHRRHDDDRATVARLDHGGQGGAQGLPGADEVDVDDIGELFLRHLPAQTPGEYARIDHDVVQAAELRDAVGHQLLLECQVAHVALPGQDLAADLLDEPDRLGQIVRRGGRIGGVLGDRSRDVQTDDRRPFTREAECVIAALTTGDAGDVDDLAVKLSHSRTVTRSSLGQLSQTPPLRAGIVIISSPGLSGGVCDGYPP